MEYYPNYETRNALKKEGFKLLRHAKTSYEKCHIIMNRIIWADYWNAREKIDDSIDSKKCLRLIACKRYTREYILDIDLYAEHWLYAMRNDKDIFDSNETYKACCEWYVPKENKYMSEGNNFYDFKKGKENGKAS